MATDGHSVFAARQRRDHKLVNGSHSRRLVLMTGAAGAAGLLLAACGADSTGSSAEKPLAVSKAVNIIAWLPPSGNYTEYLQNQVTLFQQSQPKVQVTVEPSGATDKLQAAVVAGDPPNIQQSNFIPMFMWNIQNALEPIDLYLDKRGRTDFFDWARDGSLIKGKMYEWPWMLNPTGPVLNKSMLAEKGVANLMPQQGAKADWTFDQWRQILRAVTTQTGDPNRDTYGTAFMGTSTWYWEMM
jgi:ABC-type glycerol-3-phosphate transport system substrate-binding protein